MKRILFWLAGIFLFFLILLAIAPFLFKDTIKKKLDAELASSLNARVYYDASSFGLSFFSHFPNLTVSLDRETFANKTKLFYKSCHSSDARIKSSRIAVNRDLNQLDARQKLPENTRDVFSKRMTYFT
jgi:hypothetical protein